MPAILAQHQQVTTLLPGIFMWYHSTWANFDPANSLLLVLHKACMWINSKFEVNFFHENCILNVVWKMVGAYDMHIHRVPFNIGSY